MNNDTIKCVRILLVGLGVFFVVGNFALTSKSKSSGFKASVIQEGSMHRFLSTSAFQRIDEERYEQRIVAENTQKNATAELKIVESNVSGLKIALVHAGENTNTITKIKKEALKLSPNVLKADSNKGVWGSWIFTNASKSSAEVQHMINALQEHYPNISEYLYIKSLDEFSHYTEEGTLQNYGYMDQDIQFNLETLYQSSAKFADKADIIVVLGKAVK